MGAVFYRSRGPRVDRGGRAGEILDEALLAAVRTWRYEPAESNGVNVRVRIVERQSFTLSGP